MFKRVLLKYLTLSIASNMSPDLRVIVPIKSAQYRRHSVSLWSSGTKYVQNHEVDTKLEVHTKSRRSIGTPWLVRYSLSWVRLCLKRVNHGFLIFPARLNIPEQAFLVPSFTEFLTFSQPHLTCWIIGKPLISLFAVQYYMGVRNNICVSKSTFSHTDESTQKCPKIATLLVST